MHTRADKSAASLADALGVTALVDRYGAVFHGILSWHEWIPMLEHKDDAPVRLQLAIIMVSDDLTFANESEQASQHHFTIAWQPLVEPWSAPQARLL